MTTHREHNPGKNHEESTDIRELTEIVNSLITMMSDGNIGSLKLESGTFRLSLRSKDCPVRRDERAVAETLTVEPDTKSDADGSSSTDQYIRAPMIGTFYVAPAPNEPPFVAPGDRVDEGQTIGIIEAMKIMNEIAADYTGTVIEVVAGDGQTVEYGSPLIRISPIAG